MGVIPVLLALLVLRFLVPPRGAGIPGVVVWVGHRYPVPFGVGCFFLFSTIARSWRFLLPGGRYASALPAHIAPMERNRERLRDWEAAAVLYDALTARAMRPRIESTLDLAQRSEVDRQLAALREGLEMGRLEQARGAARCLEALAAAALAMRRRREVFGTLGAVALAAAAAMGIRAAYVDSYQVLSSSMLPTLAPDDRIAGRKLASPSRGGVLPSRGEVVIFQSSAVAMEQAGLPDVLVKRVIGLPGDRITMHGGAPAINGWQLPTCVAGQYLYVAPNGEGGALQGWVSVEFLEDRAYLTLQSVPKPAFAGEYVVQPGEVFVLGDNRANSMDSRAYHRGQGGGVPLSAIGARAQWFLLGTHRSGDRDFSRLLKPIDGLERRLHAEGVDSRELEGGIVRCLERRPRDTHPPPPAEPRAGDSSRPTAT